nr:MAG TPA: hypothetical protein [Caudoviricetes sp.]
MISIKQNVCIIAAVPATRKRVWSKEHGRRPWVEL